MICPSCSEELPDTVSVCGHCGAAVAGSRGRSLWVMGVVIAAPILLAVIVSVILAL